MPYALFKSPRIKITITLTCSCDREDVAEYIKSQRENKPVQSLFELAAQVVALHVVSMPSDASKNPVGSDPNFRITNKSGIAEVDEKVSEVISAAQSIHEAKRQPFRLTSYLIPQKDLNLIVDGARQQREPLDLSLLYHGSAHYYMDEQGVVHTHDETFTLNKNLP